MIGVEWAKRLFLAIDRWKGNYVILLGIYHE
jgi:hypothetical protein